VDSVQLSAAPTPDPAPAPAPAPAPVAGDLLVSSSFAVYQASNTVFTVQLPAAPAGHTQTVVIDWRTTGARDEMVSWPAEFGSPVLGTPFLEGPDHRFAVFSRKLTTAMPSRTVSFVFTNWTDLAVAVLTVAGDLVPPTVANVDYLQGAVYQVRCPGVSGQPGELLVNTVFIADYRRTAPSAGNPVVLDPGQVWSEYIAVAGGHRMLTSSGSTGLTTWDVINPDTLAPGIAHASCATLLYSPLVAR
jgi:hypothetical protein